MATANVPKFRYILVNQDYGTVKGTNDFDIACDLSIQDNENVTVIDLWQMVVMVEGEVKLEEIEEYKPPEVDED